MRTGEAYGERTMQIRQATEDDAEAIAAIYNTYIQDTIITFETQAVRAEEMAGRIREKQATHDWIVGEVDGALVGYAYYGTFRPRSAYAHTVESTIYLAREQVGNGFGRTLYSRLIASARDRGFRELIGVIALPNPASVALHEKLGFEKVGVLKQAGYKLERYVDVGLWQLSL